MVGERGTRRQDAQPVGLTRAERVRFAIASTRIEGLPTAPETEALLAGWAEGRFSDEELLRRGDAMKVVRPRG